MSSNWQPLCNKSAIIARSKLYQKIRSFFAAKEVLEVETPLLSSATVTDPYINSLEVFAPKNILQNSPLYLQTSPEFAMKRLLCTNIGSIYQICKAFRAEEIGRNHNREFSMLEWYRVGFTLEDLMAEMTELLSFVLDLANSSDNFIKISYQDLFLDHLDFDHNMVNCNYLKNIIIKLFPDKYDCLDSLDKDDLLMILLSEYIEPKLDHNKIIFLYDYPATQAALARIDNSGYYPVAKRFEVYYKGIELANGFYELADYKEQQARFERDLAKRRALNFSAVESDQNLLSALKSGLPDCSGVALGLDRLLMLKLGFTNIEQVLSFR